MVALKPDRGGLIVARNIGGSRNAVVALKLLQVRPPIGPLHRKQERRGGIETCDHRQDSGGRRSGSRNAVVALKRGHWEQELSPRRAGKQERRGGIETLDRSQGSGTCGRGSRNAVVALKRA